MDNEIKLTIGHFYPDLLNLYGDRGNVLALYRRAVKRNIKVEIIPISKGDELDADKLDICFIGGGQDSEQNIVKDDFVNVKGPVIKDMIENEKVFLTICGGYQMLGSYYREHNGNKLSCLGAINFYTEGKKQRFIGDTLYEFTDDEGNKIKVPGFENHSGRTYLGEGVKPFMKVLKGAGNNGEDQGEGAVYKNTFCTYSHGSFLPKNPAITDMLLLRAFRKRYGNDFILPQLGTSVEEMACLEAISYIENK